MLSGFYHYYIYGIIMVIALTNRRFLQEKLAKPFVAAAKCFAAPPCKRRPPPKCCAIKSQQGQHPINPLPKGDYAR
jgi:hypothetical protein